eukprot:544914_1
MYRFMNAMWYYQKIIIFLMNNNNIWILNEYFGFFLWFKNKNLGDNVNIKIMYVSCDKKYTESILLVDEYKEEDIDYKSMNEDILDWTQVCNGISHEMWPKLASAVKSIVTDQAINQHDLSVTSIDKVIDILKNKRNLCIEEQEYLRRFLQQAAAFKPLNRYPPVNEYSDAKNNIYRDFSIKLKGLLKESLH